MPIWLGSTSRTRDKEYLIDWICGAILGLWARIVRSTLPTEYPADLDSSIAFSNIRTESMSFVLRTVVGEIVSDVRESERPEHCIGKCVDQAIGIRMPEQSPFMGNFNSAKD